jgi:type IV pilus assembly protein PilE
VHPSFQSQRGFTLIEVITVVVILGILAAIAIPNYTEYVQRGRRADAKTALTQMAQWQERRRTETNSYATATAQLPGLANVQSNNQTIYTITVDAGATATAYTLTATRAGVMANDPCGDFTLTSLGVRGSVNNTRPAQECWAR